MVKGPFRPEPVLGFPGAAHGKLPNLAPPPPVSGLKKKSCDVMSQAGLRGYSGGPVAQWITCLTMVQKIQGYCSNIGKDPRVFGAIPN